MSSLVRYGRRPLLSRVFPDVDRLFGDLWGRPWMGLGLPTISAPEVTWSPRVDMYEKDGEVVVKLDLPGVDKEHLEVLRENGNLVVRAETTKEDEVDQEGYYRCERFHGRYERAIPLPEEVKDEEIKAKFENGILEIHAPKREPEPAGRKIEVT